MIGSTEFMLAVECCRASFAGRARQEITPAGGIDWDRFLALVRFHRVEGLAWHALSTAKDLPDYVACDLRQSAMAIATRNLQATAESRTLLESFETAKVPLLFVKGITLGTLAYGNPSLKSAVDIDLLIDGRDLETAVGILQRQGWRLEVPRAADSNGFNRWHRLWKESVWLRTSPALQMDLHTRLSDNPALIGGIDVHSPSQRVDVGGIMLPALARDELFAYLTVHGASSAWFRLKWIADLAALADGQRADEITRLYRRSQELGAGRAASQALLLADALFGTLGESPELRQQLAADRATISLYRVAMRLLGGDPREPTETSLGTLPIHLSQFGLLPGAAFKWAELRGQLARVLSSRTG